ncbi:hypothetical protein ACLOJK_034946 [Asimina triloba]
MKEEVKVVDSVVITELQKPLTAYYRCWRSGTFPLYDGSHVKHNKATGDNSLAGERPRGREEEGEGEIDRRRSRCLAGERLRGKEEEGGRNGAAGAAGEARTEEEGGRKRKKQGRQRGAGTSTAAGGGEARARQQRGRE